jgi:hypothetical protein
MNFKYELLEINMGKTVGFKFNNSLYRYMNYDELKIFITNYIYYYKAGNMWMTTGKNYYVNP